MWTQAVSCQVGENGHVPELCYWLLHEFDCESCRCPALITCTCPDPKSLVRETKLKLSNANTLQHCLQSAKALTTLFWVCYHTKSPPDVWLGLQQYIIHDVVTEPLVIDLVNSCVSSLFPGSFWNCFVIDEYLIFWCIVAIFFVVNACFFQSLLLLPHLFWMSSEPLSVVVIYISSHFCFPSGVITICFTPFSVSPVYNYLLHSCAFCSMCSFILLLGFN